MAHFNRQWVFLAVWCQGQCREDKGLSTADDNCSHPLNVNVWGSVHAFSYLILTKPNNVNTEATWYQKKKKKFHLEAAYTKSGLNFIEIVKKELVGMSSWKAFKFLKIYLMYICIQI